MLQGNVSSTVVESLTITALHLKSRKKGIRVFNCDKTKQRSEASAQILCTGEATQKSSDWVCNDTVFSRDTHSNARVQNAHDEWKREREREMAMN